MDERGEFSFTEHDESDGSVRVRVIGELDAAEAPNLQEVLRRLEGEGSDVLLDLSGLSFIDVFGLHLIEEAADAARQGGFGFAIAGSVAMTRASGVRGGGRSAASAGRSGPVGGASLGTVGARRRWRGGLERDGSRPVRSGYGPDVGRS